MVAWAKSRWLSYFYSGACVFILSWIMALVLSGCRFGNYEQDVTNPDTISGFYGTSPSSLSFYTRTFAGVESTTTVNDLTLLPAFLSAIATDPVAMQVSDLTTGQAQISSPFGSSDYALPVIATNGTMSGEASADVVHVPNCDMELTFNTQGTYSNSGGNFAAPGGTVPLKGELAMAVTISWALTGSDCSFVATCYFDATKCLQTGATAAAAFDNNNQAQQMVKAAIDPEIKAGIVTTTNFQNYSDFHYTVVYQ